ncbi:hypothetical protein O6H91_02G081000 [Diphasiastrum complanatum]|uniref:Uncharacterized protein n=1 Tax=Diphasiastrum complanatum TaxID=34168 RepID=A0ACC2EH93_DIPCM|nr:hypothetical protein O6H91_02G081000 [Diphasiastrum complanatum]
MALYAAGHPSTAMPINKGHSTQSRDGVLALGTRIGKERWMRAPLGIALDMNKSFRLQKSSVRLSYFGQFDGLAGMERGRVDVSSRGVAALRVRAGAEPVVTEKTPPKRKMPGENKGFVEEMRFVAMRLHTKDQAKEGQQDNSLNPVAKWEPTVGGYLKFLVNSKLIFDTLEEIVDKATHPSYALFKNTGLERSAALATDLEWFESQGHKIPNPGPEGTSYAELLRNLSETNPPAFICHFYNVYFAHSAGGRFIGKQVAQMILDGKELNFYKWDGELPELLATVKEKLNSIAENWTREEKDHCLEETRKSFKFSGDILRLIVT